MSKCHELKSWPQEFCDVISGKKSFEYRKNDRDFNVGDTIRLKEYDPFKCVFTGFWQEVLVVYVLKNAPEVFGLPVDYCVLGIKLSEAR